MRKIVLFMLLVLNAHLHGIDSMTMPATTAGAVSNASERENSVPYGDPDFYPTSDRTIGWRGDGNGAWPGAVPVQEWNATTGKNIVWKTPMPGPSFSQPIVVGDKVFTLADPNWLICLSAADGKILWQKEVDHTTAMPPELASKARAAAAFWDDQFSQYAIWLDVQSGQHPQLPQAQIDQALKAADQHDFAVNGVGQANFDMMSRSDPLWARCLKDQAAYSLYYFGHWEGILTHTFATPVSDGQRVFVNMANDQVACYDLNGNCKWLIWDRPKQAQPGEMHVRYMMSPQLVGDKLMVAACGELRAYDKLTGKKLWSVYKQRDFGMYWVKVGPPVHMRLTFEGKPFDVLLSPGSGIYRLDDGKLVGSLPDMTGYEGSTALTDGQIYLRKDAPDSGSAVRLAGRFKVVSPDQVEFEETWQAHASRRASGNTTDVLFDGWVYSPQTGLRIELSTGKTGELRQVKESYSSAVLGGRMLVVLGGGGYGKREKQPGVINATVIDLDHPKESVALDSAFVDQRYAEDQAYRLRWRWRGNGDTMSNSSPSFQANRMFFRTVGYLWCVGDPTQPWPTPHTAPADARVRPTRETGS